MYSFLKIYISPHSGFCCYEFSITYLRKLFHTETKRVKAMGRSCFATVEHIAGHLKVLSFFSFFFVLSDNMISESFSRRSSVCQTETGPVTITQKAECGHVQTLHITVFSAHGGRKLRWMASSFLSHIFFLLLTGSWIINFALRIWTRHLIQGHSACTDRDV